MIPCPDCTKTFADDNALFQHWRWSHRKTQRRDTTADDVSLAEAASEAIREQIAGEPVEEWERPYLP